MKKTIFAICLVLSLFQAEVVFAQQHPNKPIRIIVPLSSGGTSDVLVRAIGKQLGEALGQPVIIDNKPGGNSIIGTDALAKAPADGYTMGMLISSHAINPHTAKSLPYDSVRDFTPISLVAIMPGILSVHPSVPIKNIQELIAFAKAKPGTRAVDRMHAEISKIMATPAMAQKLAELGAESSNDSPEQFAKFLANAITQRGFPVKTGYQSGIIRFCQSTFRRSQEL